MVPFTQLQQDSADFFSHQNPAPFASLQKTEVKIIIM